MSNRHLSRSIALQTLFEFDVRDNFTLSDEQLHERLVANIAEFAPGLMNLLPKQLLIGL
jgi:hypothetical protein